MNKLLFIGMILALFLSLTYFAHVAPYFADDLFLTHNLQQFHAKRFDGLMLVLTRMGNTPVAVLSVGLAFVILSALRHKTEAWLLVATSSTLTLLGKGIKSFVARPRPDPTLVQQLNIFHRADSFPSGHVLFFVGFYGMLIWITLRLMQKSNLRTFLCTFWGVLIVLIGVSRIHLGAHWFSDVLGAYCLGLLWLWLMIAIYKVVIPTQHG